MITPHSGFRRLARNRAFAIAGAFERIHYQHHDIRAADRALREQHAHRFDRAARRDASRPSHSGGVDDAQFLFVPIHHGVDRVARRAGRGAHHHALFLEQTIDERRLPDVRPADDRDGDFILVGDFWRVPRRQQAPHLVQKFGDARAVLGGYFEDRLEAHLVELERAALRAAIVRFVDRENHRLAERTNLMRDFFVARHQTFAAVNDEHDEIGFLERAETLLDDELV